MHVRFSLRVVEASAPNFSIYQHRIAHRLDKISKGFLLRDNAIALILHFCNQELGSESSSITSNIGRTRG